jgi:hypothetical protein
MTVQAPAATDGGGGGGPPPPPPGSDGGVSSLTSISLASVFPSYVIVSGAANAGQNLPGTATATFSVISGGLPASGASVNFAEVQGESLVTLGATSGTTDAFGIVTLTLTGKAVPGLAHVTAWITGSQVTMTLPVLGAPGEIIETASAPSVLGLKGSGIQENGLMTFRVTDTLGSPVPGVTVNFTEAQPALVTLGRTSAITDATGHVVVDYASGAEVGVSSIVATVAASGATASHAIAVRGAKPSASGFYFSCAKANLPVYTTTPRFETTVCTVRLSDRFGNRVGIPTPVNFAAEAGAISASAVTKAFDFGNPADPDEGSVTVTFSSDMGNGSTPADVDPLPVLAGQFPWPRQAEPNITVGSLIRNPRDQLVTIIAMTQGEEGFIDANHNGVLDINEVFFDLGDPFIDANDDGAWDQVYTGGPWEVRFCGLNADCSTYHGPNGKWDSLTTIWVPTWVVFSGVAAPSTTPAGQPAPATDFVPNCLGGMQAGFSDIYVYDAFLNSPSAGTGYGSPQIFSSTTANPPLTPKGHGFNPELDNWGAMGALGFDFAYRAVSTTGGLCQAPATPTAATPCLMKLLFRDFDFGYRGTVEVDDTSTSTVACSTTNIFRTIVQVNGAHGTLGQGLQVGHYTP